MTPRERAVEYLKDLVKALEASEVELQVTIIEHCEPVHDVTYGGMITGTRWLGRSIVLQTEHVNLSMLANELFQRIVPTVTFSKHDQSSPWERGE